MRRWIAFNGVGILGFLVQLGVLAWLLRLGVPYLVATAGAVEAAVLHNFVWHERWTWRERTGSGPGSCARLRRFQVLNGAVSLVGNVVVSWLLVRYGTPPLFANALAVLPCALVTFVAADRLVFPASDPRSDWGSGLG